MPALACLYAREDTVSALQMSDPEQSQSSCLPRTPNVSLHLHSMPSFMSHLATQQMHRSRALGGADDVALAQPPAHQPQHAEGAYMQSLYCFSSEPAPTASIASSTASSTAASTSAPPPLGTACCMSSTTLSTAGQGTTLDCEQSSRTNGAARRAQACRVANNTPQLTRAGCRGSR